MRNRFLYFQIFLASFGIFLSNSLKRNKPWERVQLHHTRMFSFHPGRTEFWVENHDWVCYPTDLVLDKNLFLRLWFDLVLESYLSFGISHCSFSFILPPLMLHGFFVFYTGMTANILNVWAYHASHHHRLLLAKIHGANIYPVFKQLWFFHDTVKNESGR